MVIVHSRSSVQNRIECVGIRVKSPDAGLAGRTPVLQGKDRKAEGGGDKGKEGVFLPLSISVRVECRVVGGFEEEPKPIQGRLISGITKA